MNKYARALICVPYGALKMLWTKAFHLNSFFGPGICLISPHTEITLENGAELHIGKKFKMRDGAKIRVRKGAVCKIGDNVSLNSNNMVVCHERIEIGNDVQFSPNVQIYDHDHDFRIAGGIKAGKFNTSPIKIGSNVWVGANSVILRGTEIGDNCVIGAGCIIKGKFPPNVIVVQKRQNTTQLIFGNNDEEKQV